MTDFKVITEHRPEQFERMVTEQLDQGWKIDFYSFDGTTHSVAMTRPRGQGARPRRIDVRAVTGDNPQPFERDVQALIDAGWSPYGYHYSVGSSHQQGMLLTRPVALPARASAAGAEGSVGSVGALGATGGRRKHLSQKTRKQHK
jgi:hypothetical protein